MIPISRGYGQNLVIFQMVTATRVPLHILN
jgi:hypothetical protein